MSDYIDDPFSPLGYRSYNPVYYSTQPDRLRFIPDNAAYDLDWLLAVEEQGHFTHLGSYDNDAGRDWYFLTTDPNIQLSGWNRFVYPLSTWIGWARARNENNQSTLNTNQND